MLPYKAIIDFANQTVFWTFVVNFIVNSLAKSRRYSSMSTPVKTLNDLIRHLDTSSGKRMSWSQGVFLFNKNQKIPMFIISLDPRDMFIAYGVQKDVLGGYQRAHMEIEITVWTLSCNAPIVPDPVGEVEIEETNQIKVIMNKSCNNEEPNMRPFREMAVLPVIPEAAIKYSEVICGKIIEGLIFHNRGFYVKVIVLGGESGIGKSTAARMLTLKIKYEMKKRFNVDHSEAYLCKIDIGHPGQNIWDAIDQGAGDDENDATVIVMEEFDRKFKSICDSKDASDGSSGKMSSQAYNKKSWNDLFDALHYKSNIVILMTTNESKEKLLEIQKSYDDSGSMLRRVDLWIHE